MLSKLFFLIALIPCLAWSEDEKSLLSTFIHEYKANCIYEGDAEGYSSGDFIAVLDDGSQWKIRSKDLERFSKWNFGDKVHIGVQTSWYLFKKNFLLVNHENNESLEVLLIETPLIVYHSEQPQPTKYIDHGLGLRTYHDYRQNIITSDGQKWEIIDPKSKNSFPQDSPIYIGYNEYSTSQSIPGTSQVLEEGKKYVTFFIINGTGQNANWWWAGTGNWNYYFFPN